MTMTFAGKARTLEALRDVVSRAALLPQLRVTVAEWRGAGRDLSSLHAGPLPAWLGDAVIVRSSCAEEDGSSRSMAGRFLSIPNVHGLPAIADAIDAVIASFGEPADLDEVFIQPMLRDVAVSGVAFTRDPATGGHVYVVNYDDQSGATDTVTAGTGSSLRTYYGAKASPFAADRPWLRAVIELLGELEQHFGLDALDVEFAVDRAGTLYLLQVRPLVLREQTPLTADEQTDALLRIRDAVEALQQPHPHLRGSRSVFGIMPDWNPAEIIGVRPRPLALSLYKALITDSTWAYQRDNYGYRNLRSFPLLVSFGGCPYIDVRVSFNSFVPKDVDEDLAERLVEHYITRLIDTPSHHDKVEFEIIYSCYTFDLGERLGRLQSSGFSKEDCEQITRSLRALTNAIISDDRGLWRIDIGKIEQLKERQRLITESGLQPIAKVYWLLEDCKRYGTLPFAGLARAGFIAAQILRSLVSTGVLTQRDVDGFMGSLDTVSSRLQADFESLPRDEFLAIYGHLRPGTYDILSPRYDETPERYFSWGAGQPPARRPHHDFAFPLPALNRLAALLQQHGIEHDVLSLLNFLKGAIEGREYAKFVFSRSLSDSLRLLAGIGAAHGFTPEDMSFADIGLVSRLYSSSASPRAELAEAIAHGRREYDIAKALTLPPLIVAPDDVFGFEPPASEPNYITQRSITASAVTPDQQASLRGNIVMIPSADPGYDWIFSRGVGGFITMYGGANSHMAVRASELGLPAVIGAGETLYTRWAKAKWLEVDCGNKLVRVLS